MTNLEKKSCDVIFLDTETTGLECASARRGNDKISFFL